MRGKTLIGALLLASSLECIALAPEDSAIMRGVVEYLVPKRGCRRVEGQEAPRPALIDTLDVNGDTNRLARVLVELAQTNDAWYAEMAMWQLEKYGTSEQLPFLYSCATNPAVGDRALKSIFAIEGVTSNSISATQGYLAITNAFTQQMDYNRSDVCEWLLKEVSTSPNLAYLKPSCLTAAVDYAQNISIMHKSLDEAICAADPTYQHSKRRLAVMRSAQNRCWNAMLTNYVTNAINELVAYPEANLPD